MLTSGLRFHPEYENISRSQPFLRNNPLRLNQVKCFREKKCFDVQEEERGLPIEGPLLMDLGSLGDDI